jgi:hypothetical protein
VLHARSPDSVYPCRPASQAQVQLTAAAAGGSLCRPHCASPEFSCSCCVCTVLLPIAHTGKYVLGDFGSSRPLGAQTQESTPTQWPADRDEMTCTATDYFQLAVTLLHRAKALTLSPRGLTHDEVREAAVQLGDSGASRQLRDFVLELLAGQ